MWEDLAAELPLPSLGVQLTVADQNAQVDIDEEEALPAAGQG